MLRIVITTTIAVLALALAPTAMSAGGSPTDVVYGGEATVTEQVMSASTSSSDGGGFLPFTGLDLAIVLVGGMALVAAGIGLRRLSRARDEA